MDLRPAGGDAQPRGARLAVGEIGFSGTCLEYPQRFDLSNGNCILLEHCSVKGNVDQIHRDVKDKSRKI